LPQNDEIRNRIALFKSILVTPRLHMQDRGEPLGVPTAVSVVERSRLSCGLLDAAPTDSENESKAALMRTFMGGESVMNVRDVMTPHVASVSPDESVAVAARLMLQKKISGLLK
jgi:CBS domain-containing protein